jgi:hypothetical protein
MPESAENAGTHPMMSTGINRLRKSGMGRLGGAFPRKMRPATCRDEPHLGDAPPFLARKFARASSTTRFSAAC